MSFSQTHTGISITGEKLQLIELTYNNNGIFVENIDEEFFEEYLNFFSKETKFNFLLQKAFDNLIIRKPLKNNMVSFALPFDIFKSAELPFDNSLIKADLLDQFKWELSVLYPYISPNAFLLQHIEINDEETAKKEIALVIATIKKQIKSIHKFCVRNNLILKYIDFAHFTFNNLIKAANITREKKMVVSAYISNGYLSVTLLKNEQPILLFVKKIINAADIIPQIELATDKINELNVSLQSIENFYIAGDNISDELLKQINIKFNINFIKLNPFTDCTIAPELNNSKYIIKEFNSFSSAAGIALRLL